MASDEASTGVFHRFPQSRLPEVAETVREAIRAAYDIETGPLTVQLKDNDILLQGEGRSIAHFEMDEEACEAFAELDAIEDDPEALEALPPEADIDDARVTELEDLLLDAIDDLYGELVAWRADGLDALVEQHWSDVLRHVAVGLYGDAVAIGPTLDAVAHAVVALDLEADEPSEGAGPGWPPFGVQVSALDITPHDEPLIVLMDPATLDHADVRHRLADAIVEGVSVPVDSPRAREEVQRRLDQVGEAVVVGEPAAADAWQATVDALVAQLAAGVDVARREPAAGLAARAVLRST